MGWPVAAGTASGATAVSGGCAWERQRRGEARGEVEGIPGGCVASPEEARRSGKQEVVRCAPACVGHAPVPTGARRKATRGEAAVGWAVLGRWWRQVSGWRS